jgi:hypothetical protein
LVGGIVLCGDYSKDDGPRVPHVLLHDFEDQLLIGLCRCSCRTVYQSGKVNERAEGVSASWELARVYLQLRPIRTADLDAENVS